MKKILNVSEMKQVCGGAAPSSHCYPGEKLYTCTTTYDNNFQSTGVVCASDGVNAAGLIYRQRIKEGASGIASVACA
ncbi:hypothetical protein [Bacteroides sp. UBA939]|uniref:hypothetical protein n=1 Tax=Bacteroides sp. UBA939 TaxID=1946092 RepID=UPI0025C1305B|nr:hypothetical protein [Bacteroides sp. UBA939]